MQRDDRGGQCGPCYKGADLLADGQGNSDSRTLRPRGRMRLTRENGGGERNWAGELRRQRGQGQRGATPGARRRRADPDQGVGWSWSRWPIGVCAKGDVEQLCYGVVISLRSDALLIRPGPVCSTVASPEPQ